MTRKPALTREVQSQSRLRGRSADSGWKSRPGTGRDCGKADCGAPAGVIVVTAEEAEIAVVVVTATENTIEVAFRAYDQAAPLPIVAPGTANQTLGAIVDRNDVRRCEGRGGRPRRRKVQSCTEVRPSRDEVAMSSSRCRRRLCRCRGPSKLRQEPAARRAAEAANRQLAPSRPWSWPPGMIKAAYGIKSSPVNLA